MLIFTGGFGKYEKEEHNDEIKEATRFLINTMIPAFAVTLSERFAEKQKLKSTMKLSEIVKLVHAEGICVRHLVSRNISQTLTLSQGIIRSHVTNETLKQLLLIEVGHSFLPL